MLHTFEAILDERGQIQFTEPVRLRRSGRVLITMLTEQVEQMTPDESETSVFPPDRFDKPRQTGLGLVEFFQHSPLYGVDLDLTRSKETGREIVL